MSDVEDQLRRPLRVAIGGKISAGKSTLVNALLGMRVADVRADETRRVTTLFRHAAGENPSASAILEDGSVRSLDWAEGDRLPNAPGARRYEVALNAAALEHMTIVDTPGLFSAEGKFSEHGRRAILGPSLRGTSEENDTRTEIRAADALLFLLSQTVSESDLAVLGAYAAQFAQLGKSGFNAVAVMGKADQIEAGNRDSFDAAEDLAAEAKASLGAAVAEVVPVSGLLATAATAIDRETVADRDLLTALAREPPEYDWVFRSIPAFESKGRVGNTEERTRLATRLGRYGLSFAVRYLREPSAEATGLEEALERRSGVTRVRRILREHFLSHADIIKAESALGELEAAAHRETGWEPTARRRALEEVSRTMRHPDFHRISEAVVLREIASGGVELQPDLKKEATRLLIPGEPCTRLGHASGAAVRDLILSTRAARVRWQRVSGDRLRPLATQRAAKVILETLDRLHEGVVSASSGRAT